MSDLTRLLRRYFSQDESLLKALVQVIHLAEGEVLFRQGDKSDAFYWIQSGQIRVSMRGPAGAEIPLHMLYHDDLLGELALMDDRPRSTTATALTPCTLLQINRETFLQQVRDSPAGSQLMLDLVSERFRDMTEYVEQLEYWTQMLMTGQYSQVIQSLEQTTSQGDRASIAVAELIGNLAKAVEKRENDLRQQVFYQLEKGREIQKNFLPKRLLQIPGWEIKALFQPALQVAGDFYDVFKISDKAVGLAIADVCDKGVGAALFMALFRSLIRIYATLAQRRGRAFNFLIEQEPIGGWIGDSTMTNMEHLSILQAVSFTNRYVSQNHGDLGMFATLFLGVLDPTTGLLSYINGGHEPLLIISESGGVRQQLPATDPAVGVIPDMDFQIHQTYLHPGETLFGYTDGVTDARSIDASFFTLERLLKHLDAPIPSAQALIDSISTSLQSHVGEAAQFDDMTMLAVRRQPADATVYT